MKSSNLHNLIALWELAGSRAGKIEMENGISLSFIPKSEWPNRIWSSSFWDLEKTKAAKPIAHKTDSQLKLSIFHKMDQNLEDQMNNEGFELVSKQTGMDLDLSHWKGENQPDFVHLELVKSVQEAKEWSKLFTESFGYTIAENTVIKLMHDISFYIIYHDNNPAGTIFLFPTENTIGFHSLGIINSMRRKGIAQSTMITLLLKSKLEGYTNATLQASDMAVNMYQCLGFHKQFTMFNYQIKKL